MKEIILLGKTGKTAFFDYVMNSCKFKIRRLRKLESAKKVIEKAKPDFVLCSGRMRVDAEGNYFLELDSSAPEKKRKIRAVAHSSQKESLQKTR